MYKALVSSEEIFHLFESGKKLSQCQYRGRFAPSPTGPLHLGNVRTALFSWLRAKSKGGKWFLRIDDIDSPRNRLGSIERIQEDLNWLGLVWDGPVLFQSKRIALYQSALMHLKTQNKLYGCQCSRKLLSKVNNLRAEFIYPGTCRNLGLSLEEEKGRVTSLRLKVSKKFSKICGDIVLRRSDGFIAYHLATVIDELSLGINEVVRGKDLAQSKYAQLAIIDAFKQDPISYKHLPIFFDSDGKKLSKRNDEKGLETIKNKGISSETVIGLLANSLGLLPPGESLSPLELLSELTRKSSSYNNIFVN